MTARAGSRLFLDIETIPTQDERLKEYVTSTLKPPSNYKKDEAIEKWLADNADKAWRNTSLDGAFGELLVVSYAVDGGPVLGTYREIEGSATEKELLVGLWNDLSERASDAGTIWVGHKLMFDMLFLRQRSIVNRVRPSLHIPYQDRAWAGTWEDTNVLWTGNDRLSDSVSLDKLCTALGIESPKDGIDGSMVWDAVKEKRYEDVLRYNVADVEATREAYMRLTGWSP